MKKILPILIALVLAAVASLGIVNWSKSINQAGRTQTVIAASHLLRPGDVLSANDLGPIQLTYPTVNEATQEAWSSVFADFIPPDNQNTLIGRVVSEEIKQGNPIRMSALESINREMHRTDWKTKIPEGKRGISIPVTGINAVNGLVEVSDRVDVLVTLDVPKPGEEGETEKVSVPVRMGDSVTNINMPTGERRRGEPMTFYLLQNVEVLSVGDQTYRLDELADEDPLMAMAQRSGGGGQGVTVALEPREVLLLSFVTAGGGATFTLSLRTPGDESLYDTVNNPPIGFKQMLTAMGVVR